MKQLFCLLLAVCMMASLCACGKGREKDAGNDALSSNEEASASAESIPTPKEQETPGKSKPSQSYAGKVDVDLTVLSSTMVYSEVYNMLYYDQESYYGKTVKANGIFAIYQMVVDGVTQPAPVAYACIIARYFGADYTLIAHSGRGAARNYGDKNATSQNTMADRVANTFDEAAEPAWDFAASPYRPDLVVINLGSNDFSTLPHPSRDECAAAYTRILQTLRGAYGDEMPILCVAPRVSEPAFTYIRDLCQSGVVPNLHFAAILPGYCNDGSELGSSAHPNYAGHRKMAMLLIPYVSTLTGWEAEIKPID